ncbi:MAG: hypothetical protein ACI9OI_000251, partial [Chitinophagales bacterium]
MKKTQIAVFTTALLISNAVVAQNKNLEEVVVEGQYLSSN